MERILRRITDEKAPVDLDRLLVMTFTNAAAAEMRERIGEALEKRLEEDPGDRNLERQSMLLPHAKITTIDSLLPGDFCGSIFMSWISIRAFAWPMKGSFFCSRGMC